MPYYKEDRPSWPFLWLCIVIAIITSMCTANRHRSYDVNYHIICDHPCTVRPRTTDETQPARQHLVSNNSSSARSHTPVLVTGHAGPQAVKHPAETR